MRHSVLDVALFLFFSSLCDINSAKFRTFDKYYTFLKMNTTEIKDRLSRVAALVDGWQDRDSIATIERDLALEELRRLYDLLLMDSSAEAKGVAPSQSVKVTVAVEEPLHDDEIMDEDTLDIDALLGLTDTKPIHVEMQPATEGEGDVDKVLVDEVAKQSVEQRTEELPVVVEEHEEQLVERSVPEVIEVQIEEKTAVEQEVAEEPKEEPAEESKEEQKEASKSKPAVAVGGGLFDIDDIPVRTKSGRKMLSLYDTPAKRVVEGAATVATTSASASAAVPQGGVDVQPIRDVDAVGDPEPQPQQIVKPQPQVKPMQQPQPQPQPQSQPQQPTRLADVLGGKVTLADKMVDDTAPMPAMNRINDLRKAIGLNDRFLMIRDLFAGDAARYEDTIDTLNEFDDLDECMIYIVENFAWNPDSEGAKMLVSLIERKLS